MDSLTQIVLGAAMGEAVAGRKIGNKAMLWGAVAGTIPDLDVFVGPILGWSAEASLAFHRGISHSILFAVLAPLLLALYTWWLYGNEHHKKLPVKVLTGIGGVLFLIFCTGILNFIAYQINGKLNIIFLILTIGILSGLSYFLINKNVINNQPDVNISFGRWYLLFFLAVLTHPILDSCTGYGTQLFQPFSDMRVAWNNISVADPLYTAPFLVFLFLASTRKKHNRWRSIFNYAGIIYSLIYMGWTIRNKFIVDRVFRDSLAKKELKYTRYLTTPTILNNVLWHCIAEGDGEYYDGQYSLLDKKKEVNIQVIKKNDQYIKYGTDKRIKTIKWFTDDYYNVIKMGGDTIQINDLRYGPYTAGDTEDPNNYIFPFLLVPNSETGEYTMKDQSGPPEDGTMEDFWNTLITRVKGI
jgi:inner membrane protein